MEIQKPENTHLEQLARSVDGTITDPNQCLICKRILSCKSALMVRITLSTVFIYLLNNRNGQKTQRRLPILHNYKERRWSSALQKTKI